MTNRSRVGLIVLAALVAVAAFVVLSPDDTDEKADDPGDRAAQTAPQAEEAPPTATAPSAPPPAADEIVLRGGKPEGGVQRIEVEKGDSVRLLVSSDQADELHLHGYDITRRAAPGKPARFRFAAKAEGVFELESHTAEDAGLDPLVGRVVVEPG